MDENALREQLQQTGARRTDALRVRDEASAKLAELIPQAQAAGVSISEIARLTGLSRMGVYDMLGKRMQA